MPTTSEYRRRRTRTSKHAASAASSTRAVSGEFSAGCANTKTAQGTAGPPSQLPRFANTPPVLKARATPSASQPVTARYRSVPSSGLALFSSGMRTPDRDRTPVSVALSRGSLFDSTADLVLSPDILTRRRAKGPWRTLGDVAGAVRCLFVCGCRAASSRLVLAPGVSVRGGIQRMQRAGVGGPVPDCGFRASS